MARCGVAICAAWAVATCLAVASASRMSEPPDGSFKLEPPHLFSSFDKEIAKFAAKFAKTSAGQMLTALTVKLAGIHRQYPNGYPQAAPAPGANPIALPQPPAGMEAQPQTNAFGPLDGYSTASPQRGHTLLTAYVSLLVFLSAIPFAILGILGGGENLAVYTFVAITGYAVASLSMAVLYGFIPDWALCLISLTCAGASAFASYKAPKVKELVFFVTFFACSLAACLVYDIYAWLPFETINPAYAGFAGLIFDTGVAGQQYWVLRLLYILFVVLFAGILYSCLPRYVHSAPKDATEEKSAVYITRYIVCFVCSWPVAGAVSQIMYLFGATLSPLDPLSFFYVPSQLRLFSWETYVTLLVWAGLTFLFAFFREKVEQDASFSPELLSKEVQEQWRKFTSTE